MNMHNTFIFASTPHNITLIASKAYFLINLFFIFISFKERKKKKFQ